MMKRFPLFIILIACVLCASAQKYSLNRAYNLFYEKDYLKAKECIDACVQDEKLSTKAATWLYKANIYYNLATSEYTKRQEDASYQIQLPNSPVETYLAFKKAAELNKNVEASEMLSPFEALPRLYPLLFMEGINLLLANDFAQSESVLALATESYEMQKPEYPLNGELYYYYAYTLEMQHKTEQAQKYYVKAIDDGSTNLNVYIRLIESYKQSNDRQSVLDLISKGKGLNASDVNILVAEADYYYWIGENAKGRELLAKLPNSVYQSPDALVNAANLYIKDNAYSEAESMLKRAYQQSPDNSVITHNLGVCCSNIGEAKYLEANKLELAGKPDEAKQVKADADRQMADAAFYFEKALAANANDLTLMQKLKEIYLRLSQNDKADAMEKRINSIK